MQHKNELYDELSNIFNYVASKKQRLQKDTRSLREKFDIPIAVSSDYLTGRISIRTAEDYLLFILAKFYKIKVEEYFSIAEIARYQDAKYMEDEDIFPIKLNMIQISDDQWIGRIEVKEIMRLRDCQMINYNENIQRTLRKTKRGGIEGYTINVNKVAVKNIQTAFEDGLYIPNTITLNMPDDVVYTYDEEKNILKITELDHFDIADGYHRYLAMSRAYNADEKFNYTMELRITNFSESKAKQFTWQEDQKTKMRKIDSNSMNQNDASNKVCERLNVDPTFNLSGQISRNKGIINTAFLSQCISATYLNKIPKSEINVKIILTTAELKTKINIITEQNVELLSVPWDNKLTAAVVVCCYNNCMEKVISLYERVKNTNILSIESKQITVRDITRMEKLL